MFVLNIFFHIFVSYLKHSQFFYFITFSLTFSNIFFRSSLSRFNIYCRILVTIVTFLIFLIIFTCYRHFLYISRHLFNYFFFAMLLVTFSTTFVNFVFNNYSLLICHCILVIFCVCVCVYQILF